MFATYMLHDDSLLTKIAQATMSDPFATDIMVRINDPSQLMQRTHISVTLHFGMGYCIEIASFTYQLGHVAPKY